MELAKNCFVRTLRFRIDHYICHLDGKDGDKRGWHFVLLDWDKKDKFLEKWPTDYVDVSEYGKILHSDWGPDVPQTLVDKSRKFFNDLPKSFFLLRFETDRGLQIYYVWSDVGKELEMQNASSVEDARLCGMILYSSFDEDPPEALAYILEAAYFGLKSDVSLNVACSPFDAVLNGKLPNVREFLNSGKDVNSTDSRGWTLLHHFAHQGRMDIITFLKSKGADFQVRDRICGRKPVHIAAREGHMETIEFFLKNGAIVNEADGNNWTLLHYAAWKGNVETVGLLIENNAENNSKDLTMGKKPIHLAAEYGHNDVIEVLLENGVEIEDEDNFGRTPLYYAAWMGNLETAKFLIDKGADMHKKTKFETRPIHVAAAFNNKEVLDLFLAFGVDVDEPDGLGDTPLHHAVDCGHLDLIQFLVDKKANLNIANNSGKKPIDYCVENTDIFLYLSGRMVTVFQDEEEFNDALKCCEEMLELLKEKLGMNHPETLKARHQEANILYKQGQYDAAVTSFKSVLEARARCLGDNHVDTLDTKHGLGLVYFAQMKYENATEIFKEIYEKRQAFSVAYQLDTLNIARDMAYVHLKSGKRDKAFEIFRIVFEKRKAHFGEDHPHTLQSKQDMMAVLFDNGGKNVF